VSVSENEVRPELAPGIQRFRDGLENERKKLLRDKSGNRPTFSDPEQLRQFIAQYLYPQMIGMVEMFGLAFQDVYSTAMSNVRDMAALRKWSVRNFQAAGVNVSEDGGGGVSEKVLNDVMQEFYALGALLGRKLPGDAEVEAQWNAVAERLGTLYSELQSVPSDEDDEDEDGEDEDEDGEDGGDEPQAAAADETAPVPTESEA
jgi:hypothetical protein